MNSLIKKRIMEEAMYILKTKKTIREISQVFNISKSTVHKDLHERLIDIDIEIHNKVKNILEYHKQIRHIKGGESTKKKYEKLNLLIENK